MSEMRNPFAEERDRTVYEIGRGVSLLFAVAFMTMLALPALTLHVSKALAGKWSETPAAKLFSYKPAQGSLQSHIHAVEKGLDSAEYAKALRQNTQQWLTINAREGNRKTFVGYEGWLFYQADLKALTGYGPLKKEPFSVMKNPELGKLPETHEVIASFAAQLKERGISLLLVPVPLKTMFYSEYINPDADFAWMTHPDAAAYYQNLREKGVDVLDLTDDLSKLRTKRKHVFLRVPDRKDKEAIAQAEADFKQLKQAFLKQDTHWTPEAMRFMAEKVAAHVKATYPQAVKPLPEPIRALDGTKRESIGDLVKLLDVKSPEQLFSKESVFLRVIPDGSRSEFSSISLLGDSFVNIYDDPTLGFENPDKKDDSIKAGFAQHLSLLLQQPLDVIAMNGKGSTGVRREFAQRYDDEVRSKKLVVWVIAARDLLLSKTAARDANIEWAPVTFNTKASPLASAVTPATDEPVVVEAVLSEKSSNQELNGTPYTNALHTAVYDVSKVVSGQLEAKQVLGVQWTFKEKQLQPTAGFAVGQRYKLTLIPWDRKKELEPPFANFNLQDESTVFDAERWFVEKAELLP
jgi:hypothetical protein